MADKTEWKIGEGSYTEYRYRKNDDKNYVQKQHKNTGFIEKWGIYATDLAKEEGVSTEAIHMRQMFPSHDPILLCFFL